MTKNRLEQAVLRGIVTQEICLARLPWKADEHGCLLFGGKVLAGYGRVAIGALRTSAHRLAWTLANGEIPDSMTVDHQIMCPRHCINVDHMELCSGPENARRAATNRVNRANVPVLSMEELRKMQKPSTEQLRYAVDFR